MPAVSFEVVCKLPMLIRTDFYHSLLNIHSRPQRIAQTWSAADPYVYCYLGDRPSHQPLEVYCGTEETACTGTSHNCPC